jgi:hypothetical protein
LASRLLPVSIAHEDIERMKSATLSLAILAALGLGGCERSREPDRPFVNDANEPGPNSAFGDRNQAEQSSNARSREVAEQGGRNPEASPNPSALTSPKADPEPHDELDELAGDLGTRAGHARAEFVAASRRRLEQLESELLALETRSRQRG